MASRGPRTVPRVDAGDWAAEKREKLARAEALRAQRKADARGA